MLREALQKEILSHQGCVTSLHIAEPVNLLLFLLVGQCLLKVICHSFIAPGGCGTAGSVFFLRQ